MTRPPRGGAGSQTDRCPGVVLSGSHRSGTEVLVAAGLGLHPGGSG